MLIYICSGESIVNRMQAVVEKATRPCTPSDICSKNNFRSLILILFKNQLQRSNFWIWSPKHARVSKSRMSLQSQANEENGYDCAVFEGPTALSWSSMGMASQLSF
jgi:hypothetical protein